MARAIDHYGELARTLAPTVGWPGGAEASRRLAGERANLETMIQQGFGSSEPEPSIRAAFAMSQFMRYSALGSVGLLEAARETAAGLSDRSLEAKALFHLGQLLRLSDTVAARAYFERAEDLFEHLGNEVDWANCIVYLGEMALARSELDQAQTYYEQALALFKQTGDLQGHANCTLGLGLVALRRSDLDQAQTHHEQALTLYKQTGDLQGQANCTSGLGDVALRRSELDQAQPRYEQALALYKQTGDLQGHANCTSGLDAVALRRSELDQG